MARSTRSSSDRATTLHSLWKNPQTWLDKYRLNSIFVKVISIVRSRSGVPLKKRLDPHRETVTLLKLVAYDVGSVRCEDVFEDITPYWSRGDQR